jgi:hypothetical protein
VQKSKAKKQRHGRRLPLIAVVALALPYAAGAQPAFPRVLPPAEPRECNRDDTHEQNRAQERERLRRQQQCALRARRGHEAGPGLPLF